MTLKEVADALARAMDCEVQPSDDPLAITIQGKGYFFVVAPFFGGWQTTLHIPGQQPAPFYGEAIEMLELRMKAKLSGRPSNF